MHKVKRFKSWFFLMIGLLAVCHSADAARRTSVSVKPYEHYLNTIKSMVMDFVQVDYQGQCHQGRLYLLRPGYMRVEYARTRSGQETLPLRLVADGSRMIHYDKQLNETQLYSFDATPAGFFLTEYLSLTDGVRTKAYTEDQLTYVELIKSDESISGVLTFVFGENPLRLAKWILKDGQGSETTITVQSLQENVQIDPRLFDPHYNDPNQLFVDEAFVLTDKPLP